MADKERKSSVADTLQLADGQAEIPVVVAVHIRPLIHDEVVNGCTPCLSVTEGEPQVCCGHHTFSFDQVYGGGGMGPSNIFSDCVEPLVQGVFKGYNATVLAYGQTGSGKTYTMGSQFTPHERPKGVIPDVLVSMFDRIFSTPDVQYTLRVGFIEIHKEEIHDLLLEGVQQQPTITLREMPNGSMCIAGAKEIEVDLAAGAEESLMFVMNILMRGSMARATSMTMMNARSSRSHAVFSLTLEQRRDLSGGGDDDADSAAGGQGADGGAGKSGDDKELDLTYLCAKMLLVDLAGSERAKRTQATGARLQEGIHINQGLLSLANVIQALVDGHKHVPYRNSKLTRLLQDSLGHNSRTVMVACVSPADSNMEETINTLRYANRARNIKNKPVINRDPSAAQIVLLRQQLAAARAEIEVLRGQLHGIQRSAAAGSGTTAPDRSSGDPVKLASAQGKQELAHALAEQQAARITSKATGEDRDKALVDQLEMYQQRILELEEQAANHTRQELASARFADKDVWSTSSPELLSPVRDEEEPPRSGSPERKASPTKGGRQSERMLHRMTALQEALKRKQEQIAKLSSMEQSSDGVRARYDRLVADLLKQQDTLKVKHSELHKRLKEVDNQHTAEKIKQSKTYKKQVKDLNEQLALMKRKETEKVKLEGLMRKSEEMITRLKSDVNRIKGQKAGIAKQMSDLQQDYDSFKRGKAKEIMFLKKDSRRAETEMRRLAMLNQKQKSVLQRKIQEAEEAKKRLQSLKQRGTKRATTSSPTNGSTAPPARPMSVSSSRGGASHPSVTPFGTSSSTGTGGAGGGWSAPGGAPATVAGEPSLSMPPLGDGRDPKDWLRDEIEAASTAHYTRVVMQGTVAKRSDLSKRVKECERKVAEIDHLPEKQQKQQETTRAGLMASIKRMESEVGQCTQSIQALHSDLDAAGKQNDEAREDSTAERFAGINDVSQAKTMLSALFRMACAYNDEVNIVKATNTDLDDANEELKDRCDAALAEAEALQTELAEAQAAARVAQDEVVAAQSAVVKANVAANAAAAAGSSPGRSPGRAAAVGGPVPEVSPGRSSPGQASPGRDPQRRPLPRSSSQGAGVSPGRRQSRQEAMMQRGAAGASSGGGSVASDDGSSSREMELGSTGVIGTFDEMTPRGTAPSTLSQVSPQVGTMPSIEEERAAPDIKSLDVQFQELMQEIQLNLKPRSRNSSPDSRPRSSSAATSSVLDSRGGSLRASAEPSAHPSFKVDPGSLVQPGQEVQAPYVLSAPASKHRHLRPHSGSAASLMGLPQQPPPLPRAVDLRESGDTPSAAGEHDCVRRYGDEPPASVGGGGRSGAPTPPFTDAGPALSYNGRHDSARSTWSSSSHRSISSRPPSAGDPDHARESSRSRSQPRNRANSRPRSRPLSRTSSQEPLASDQPGSPRPAGRTRRHVFRSAELSAGMKTPVRARPPVPSGGSRRALHSTGSTAVTPRQRAVADPEPGLWWNRQLHTIDSTSIRRTPPPSAPSGLHRGSRGSVSGGIWYPASQAGMPSPPRRRTGPPALAWSSVDVQHDSPVDRQWASPRASHPPPPAAPKALQSRGSGSSRGTTRSVDGGIGVGSFRVAALAASQLADPPQLHVSGGIGRHRLDSRGSRMRSPSPAAFGVDMPGLSSHPLSIDANRSVSSSGSRRGSAGGGIGSGRVYPQGSYRSGWIPPGNK